MAETVKPPSHFHSIAAKQEAESKRLTDEAVSAFDLAVSAALRAYVGETTRATELLERALGTADTLWRSIVVPAQAAFDRQVRLAEDGAKRVLDPAHAEYDTAVSRAEAEWARTYTAATATLEAALRAAATVKAASKASGG